MAREGTQVRFLRSIFVPGDEICLLLITGPSAEAVAEVVRRASITFERVVEVNVAFDERARPGRGPKNPQSSPRGGARMTGQRVPGAPWPLSDCPATWGNCDNYAATTG